LAAAEDHAGACRQGGQDVEFRPCRRHTFSFEKDFTARYVDRQPPEYPRQWCARMRAVSDTRLTGDATGATQHCTNARHQFTRAERFGDVVVGTHRKSDNSVEFGVTRRQHHHVRVGEGAQLPAHLNPVDAGQRNVQDHDVRVDFASQGNRVCPGVAHRHLEVFAFQVAGHDFGQRDLVIDDERPVTAAGGAWCCEGLHVFIVPFSRARPDYSTTSERIVTEPSSVSPTEEWCKHVSPATASGKPKDTKCPPGGFRRSRHAGRTRVGRLAAGFARVKGGLGVDLFVAQDYWLAREVLQRGIAAIYAIGFVAAARQFRALIGQNGLLPVPEFVALRSGRSAPSIFHLHYSDRFVAATCWVGALVAVALTAGVDDLVPLWAAILVWSAVWALYLSIVNVGQIWYSFGWESLLLEAGFLAIFLGNDDVAVPVVVLWLARWLVFRLEFGAGMIKLRGDRCWRDLTCLQYHHETQPMPGPLSWWFHHLPRPLHRVEVAGNHFAQLVVPFGLFAPQPVAGVAAAIIIVTQLWLVLSGNFAWLNWLTIVLAFSAINDSVVSGALSVPSDLGAPPQWFVAIVLAFAALVVVLSYWPVRNLLSPSQRMNASFNRLHLVNSYGAFGTVTRTRDELVIEGTDDPEITDHTVWREYEFKGKPGAVKRRPRQWAPYHLRLDWLMWFVAISPRDADGWLLPLLERLLRNDEATLRLLSHNPFADTAPRYVRVQLYRYRFTTWQELRKEHAWWHRRLLGEFLGPLSIKGR
jgi:hypothetical protein